MKRCTSGKHLDYAVDGDVIYPYVFQHSDDLWTLIDACESGKLVEKSKKRKRGA